MAEVLITSFFTKRGVPASNIDVENPGFPKVRIWEVINGLAASDALVGEFIMTPIEDGAAEDGFYKFAFTSIDGYNPLSTYIFRSDGGNTLTTSEQYQVARLDPTLTQEGIENAVWDANKVDHLNVGSQGEALSQIKADTTDIQNKLYLDSDSVLDVVQLLLKMEAGRTKIDPTANTLTVFDEDCATPLRVFQLLDSSGTPSVVDVCERKPISKGVNDGTSITDTCP